MPCTPGCGACCDPVYLGNDTVEKAFLAIGPFGPQITWLFDNWSPVASEATGRGIYLKCANYDVENRSCLIYDDRPPVCRDYPNYDGVMNPDRLVCGYQAEAGRTVLPIVGVT